MGDRIRILKFTGCTENDGDTKLIHGIGEAGGDMATLCGYPFVDEVEKWKHSKMALTCHLCIGVIEHAVKYENRNGKWF